MIISVFIVTIAINADADVIVILTVIVGPVLILIVIIVYKQTDPTRSDLLGISPILPIIGVRPSYTPDAPLYV